MALLRQGTIVERAHEDLRDRSTNAPVDANTIFHWASITKTFTGIAIMRLLESLRPGGADHDPASTVAFGGIPKRHVAVGRAIEDVTGEPFETYIDKEILRPLGMTRAFFDRAPSFLRADRSHSYFVTDAGLTEAPFDFDSGITVANGGLNAPIDDMVKYLAFRWCRCRPVSRWA